MASQAAVAMHWAEVVTPAFAAISASQELTQAAAVAPSPTSSSEPQEAAARQALPQTLSVEMQAQSAQTVSVRAAGMLVAWRAPLPGAATPSSARHMRSH